MTVTSADLSQWAAHRRAVVLTVSRRVPGIDPELAASRGLELLCLELLKHGDVPDPVVFWSAAAVDVGLAMAHDEPSPDGQDAPSEVITAPVRRALDFEVLTTAMERLPSGDQQLLWDHHVESRPVAAIADEIGVLPYAAKRRLRRAENRLASSFAETHTGTADDVECESTRSALHDFVRNRLLPRRRQEVEDHTVQCAGCTRAFVDVRESYWMLRAAAPVLLLGAVTAAQSSTAVATGAGVAATGAGLGGGLATLSTRVMLTIRSALTDPVSLTATVAGGIFLTTAVTTGVARDAGALPAFLEMGTVSVSAPDDARTAVPDVVPTSPAEDPSDRPESTRFVPPGPARGDAVPPGLAKQGGTTPGLGKKDAVPPGLARQEAPPTDRVAGVDGPAMPTEPGTVAAPAQPGTGHTPPGLAKNGGTPPGQSKQKIDPPGQTRQERPAPAQEKDGTSPGRSGSAGRPDGSATAGPSRGQGSSHPVPDGARGDDGDLRTGPPDHARSRRTSTS